MHFFQKCPDQWLDNEMCDGSPFPIPVKPLGSLHSTVYQALDRIFQAACLLDFPSLTPTLPLLPPYSPLSMKLKDPLFQLQWLPITFVEGGFFLTLGNETQTSCHGPESSVDWILPHLSYVALTIPCHSYSSH